MPVGKVMSSVIAEFTSVGNEEAKPGYSTMILDCLLDRSISIATLVVDVVMLVRSVCGGSKDCMPLDGPAPLEACSPLSGGFLMAAQDTKVSQTLKPIFVSISGGERAHGSTHPAITERPGTPT